MKALFRLLDIIMLFLISVFIYGIITTEDSTNLILFVVLTIAITSYFILNVISRKKLNKFIAEQKQELLNEELNLENKFNEIKLGKFKDLKDFKAYVGENNLKSILNSDRLKGKKRIISNLVIREKGNYTHEIDVILIHTSGIFVFESKNWIGNVIGKIEEKEWKCVYNNGTSASVYNPVMQNDTHIRALKNLLALNNNRIYKSFIVFTNRVEKLNIIMQKGRWIDIVKQSNLIDKLNKQIKYSGNMLTEYEADEIYKTLMEYKNSFPENKYLHKNKFYN